MTRIVVGLWAFVAVVVFAFTTSVRSQPAVTRTLAFGVVHVGPGNVETYLDIVNLDAVPQCYTLTIVYEFISEDTFTYCAGARRVKDIAVHQLLDPQHAGAYHGAVTVEGPGRFTATAVVWRDGVATMLYPDAVVTP